MSLCSNGSFFKQKKETIGLLLTTAILVLFIGHRPVDPLFIDTVAYASLFKLYQLGDFSVIYHSSELAFNTLAVLCAKYGSLEVFFTILSLLYFAPVAYSSARMCKTQSFATFLFFLGSFSFYSYAVNGLRNGVATSLILLMFTLIYVDKKYILGTLVGILGILFHTSVLLPFCAAFVPFVIRNSNIMLVVWFSSILLSLTAPGLFSPIADIIENVTQDDRITSYTENSSVDSSSSGFRFDFLLYSAFPVFVSLIFRRLMGRNDETFERLLSVYLICNSFWVIFIRASFSNRFAYLSWFLYPLLLAYPLFNIKLFKNQGKIASLIMLAMLGFTIFMQSR